MSAEHADDAERQRLRFMIAELMPVIVALMHWHQRPSPAADAALHAAVDAWRGKPRRRAIALLGGAQ